MIKNTTIIEVKRGRCPHCGKVFGFKRYPVVFAAESLEVAKKFTKEGGFVVECPHCKGEIQRWYVAYFVVQNFAKNLKENLEKKKTVVFRKRISAKTTVFFGL